MSQLLKKFALLTACAVLALCFATRPAHAQSVAMGGAGEHLLFAYWSTENYTDTWVAIRSPLGVRVSGETMNVVRVVIRNDMGEAARDFKICLKPGDSWTATLSMGNLMVGDAGECDANVQQIAPDRNNLPHPTPMVGQMASLGDATSGYLEAWLTPDGTLVDDSVPCVAPADATDPQVGECATASGAGGGDADLIADDATPRYISGSATLVSPTAGFASSYTAVALMNCGDADATTPMPRMIQMGDDDGDGCWSVDIDGDGMDEADNNTAATAGGMNEAKGGPIQMALMGQNMDILTGRWTAIDDDNIMSHTKLVLTLPVNHLAYEGQEPLPADPDEAVRDVKGTDPVSILAFDETGAIALDSREVMLGMNVNMCMFDMHMGDDMDMMMPMLSCNGMEVGELDGMAGEFRIFNGVKIGMGDDPATANTMATVITVDGTEIDNLEDGQWPDGPFAAIGLNFSYFMGTDGVQYDQATSIQSIDVASTILTGSPGTVGSPTAQTETIVYFDNFGYARGPGADADDPSDDTYIAVVAATGTGDGRTPEHFLSDNTTAPADAAARTMHDGYAEAVRKSLFERHL